MKTTIRTILACVVMISPAFGSAVKTAHIPDSAKWVVHVDVEAFHESGIAKGMMDLITAQDSPIPPEKVRKAEEFWQKLGDVDALTLYGPSLGETKAVAVAYLDYSQPAVKKMLHISDDNTAGTHGGRRIYAFTPERRRGKGDRFLCFYDDTTIVAGGNLDNVREALNRLDGKGKSLGRANPLGAMLRPAGGSFLVLAARDVAGMVKTAADMPEKDRPRISRHMRRAAMLEKCSSIRWELGQTGETAFVTLVVSMTTEQDATNIRKAAEGLLAVAMMRGNDEDIVKVLESIEVSGEGKRVGVTIDCPVELILSKARDKMHRRVASDRTKKGSSHRKGQ